MGKTRSSRPAYQLLIVLLLCLSASAQTHAKKVLVKLAEHVSLGAVVEIGVSQAAGGSHKYGAGLLAAGLVAGFKEGADATSGRDTKKQAAYHAFSILLGAGAAAAIKH